MVREIAVFIYLRLFSFLFGLFKFLPVQMKVVFVASFIGNNINIYKELKRQDLPYSTVFLVNQKNYPHFSKYKDLNVLLFDIKYFFQFVSSIYHLATAKIVFVDNYYGFLADIQFKKNVKCIQLWHANGAIKKFGLEDHSIEFRSERARKRFKRVYNNFHKVIVGSEAMAEIFKKAFGLNEDRVLRTGIPRTDIFFDKGKRKKTLRKLYIKYPFLFNKKVILYAPTFRDEHLDTFELRINLELLQNELESDYVLLLKLHPSIKKGLTLSDNLKGFVYNFSDYPNINDLFFITDLLITDYSSLPFEFSLLNKPMIFFPYDLKEYGESRGFWENYEDLVPGSVTFSTTEIVNVIKSKAFQLDQIKIFNQKWNTYSKGNSSQNLVDYIKKHMTTDK